MELHWISLSSWDPVDVRSSKNWSMWKDKPLNYWAILPGPEGKSFNKIEVMSTSRHSVELKLRWGVLAPLELTISLTGSLSSNKTNPETTCTIDPNNSLSQFSLLQNQMIIPPWGKWNWVGGNSVYQVSRKLSLAHCRYMKHQHCKHLAKPQVLHQANWIFSLLPSSSEVPIWEAMQF